MTAVDDILYIMILQEPSLISKESFSASLENIPGLDSINKINIVSEDLYANSTDFGGISSQDFQDTPFQDTI